MKNIIILKSESDSSNNYTKILKENNFNPIFIPTLDFTYKNLSELSEKLLQPEKYSGCIFTSSRSVKAVKNALNNQSLNNEWNKLKNFCVGKATNEICRIELDLNCKGQDSGNASELSDIIYKDLKYLDINLPFLFPCGNLKLNIIEQKFKEYNFLLEEIEVYVTIPNENLTTNLVKIIDDDSMEYLVFFSPSAVNYCQDILINLKKDLTRKKLLALGTTTRNCMEGKGWNVYSTMEKPTPEYLVRALNQNVN